MRSVVLFHHVAIHAGCGNNWMSWLYLYALCFSKAHGSVFNLDHMSMVYQAMINPHPALNYTVNT